MKLKSRAFSLVEIMFVVTIIGLLGIMVLPSFLKSREQSTRKACGNNLLQVPSWFCVFSRQSPPRPFRRRVGR